jgi:hypothetical protein
LGWQFSFLENPTRGNIKPALEKNLKIEVKEV